jgi:hypothetical protein
MAQTINIISSTNTNNVDVIVGDSISVDVVSKTEQPSVDVIITGGIVGTDKNFVFTQSSASDTWTINHTLNKFPAVEVVDSANDIVIGNVTYNSTNQITITFTAAFSGKAYLN